MVGFDIPQGRRVCTIPIQIVNNLILLPVRNHSGLPLTFILDTGVATPILLYQSLQNTFEYRYQRTVTVRGLGKDEALEAQALSGVSLDIGALQGRNLEMIVLPDFAFDATSLVGVPIHGIIGYDIFAPFQVRIDYIKKQLQIRLPQSSCKGAASIIPLEIINKKPYIRAKVQQEERRYDNTLLFIDSGSSMALTLVARDTLDIPPSEQVVPVFLGTGLSGDLSGNLGRVDALYMDKHTLLQPLTAFPDSVSLRHLYAVDSIRNGSVGGEILRRFVVTFDYTAQRLYLQPNRHFKQNFEYNKSGLHLLQENNNKLTTLVVSRVEANSAAEQAGIEKGDILLSINGTAAAEWKLSELYHFFTHKKAGKRIHLKILRQGNIKISRTLVLRDLL